MKHCPSEQPFVTFAHHSPDVIFRLDPARRFVYINPAIKRLVGRPPTDFLGKTGPQSGLPTPWWQALESLCQEALSRGRPAQRKFTETIPGRTCFLQLRIIPETAPAGAEPFLLGVICDQTRRRRAEAAVRSMARFPEENPSPVLRLSGEGALLYRNGPAATLLKALGWEAGQPVPESLLTPVRAALKAGTAVEFELTTLTGQIFLFMLVALPEEGYANLYGREITERKQAEQALREREHELQLIMDTTPALISYIDTDYRYRRVNQNYARWFGQPAQTIQGRPVREILGEAAWQCVQPYMARALAGETVTYERDLPYQEGKPRWMQVTYTPDRDGAGRVRGFVAHVMDVQERHQAEQALHESEARLREADRRKDEFLALLAHELRNPLAPIRNAVAILHRTGLPEPQLQWCREVIARQVSHMARLLDDLLDISRITQGKLHVCKEPVDLRAVIQQALETSRPVIEAQTHQLTVSVPSEPLWLEADAVRLAQVFANLLNNAAKYTEPGGQLGLSVEPHSTEVTVSVRDSGIGIAPDQVSQLFEPFTQADRSLGRSQGGLGLGLALVRQLVQLHGGRVEAYSPGLGQGSEFCVHLPLATAPEEILPAHGPSTAATLPPRRRILVVDDNVDAAASVGLLLEVLGHDVQTATDGLQAVEAAARWRPELIFLDLGLPGLDGYEAARRIRAQPGGGDIRLIAVTGWGQVEDRQCTQAAGFDDHLTKPVDLTVLEAVLTEHTVASRSSLRSRF